MGNAGFSVGGKNYPSLSFGPDCVKGEPVLFYSTEAGDWCLSTLDLFRDNAQRIYDGEVGPRDVWRELYVILPGSSSLLPCALGFAGTDKEPKLLIQGTASVSGVLWTCDL
ncbi:hypothetical protein ABT282_07135 [Streptomyces sp. NPDC000927]|uniref:hypothetical protein n=1 Tax=Streptomyces sp. NPDC000927 TaxID=3154371 RepID=UPI003330CDF5